MTFKPPEIDWVTRIFSVVYLLIVLTAFVLIAIAAYIK